MFVGYCQLKLILPEGNSLKDKRAVIRSILERLRHRFNIAIAEVAEQDILRRAVIGFAAVSNESVHLEKMIQKVINQIELDSRVEIENAETNIFKNEC